MIGTEFIRYASHFSVAIPLLFYLFLIKKLQQPAHIIGAVVCLSFLADGITLLYTGNRNLTIFVGNTYSVLFFALLSWFYYELFVRRSYNKNYTTLLILNVIAYTVCFLLTVYVQGINHYQSSLWTLAGLFIIMDNIAFFHYLYRAGPGAIFIHPSVWFAVGITLYFVISTGIFLWFQYLLENTEPDVIRAIWSIHNVGNIIKNIFFAFGFYHCAKSNF